MILRTSTSHEEGCDRQFSILTKEFRGDDQGNVKSLVTVNIEWIKDASGRQTFQEVPGTEKEWPCQLALLAMGFLGPEKQGPIEQLGLQLDPRGNVKCNAEYMSSVDGVFAAGDMRRGQSLVVWAIHEGREAARSVDKYLMGVTPSAQRECGRLCLEIGSGWTIHGSRHTDRLQRARDAGISGPFCFQTGRCRS